MPQSRLFISHSSADNDLALAVEQALMPRVGVLLDRSGLEPGRPWRRDLHEWLARCHAGLLLLTRGVLAQPRWVLKEAIILGWRKDLEHENFGLFWALGPGVTRPMANDAGFALAQLDDTQRLVTVAAPGNEAALVAELAPLLQARRPGVTAFDRLADSLTRLLRMADPQGVHYELLTDELGIPVPTHWGPDRVAQLAGLVARALVVGRDEGFAVDRIVSRLDAWDARHRFSLARLLAPRWVDAQAAGAMRVLAPPKLAAGAPVPAWAVRGVAIAGQYVPDYTAEMYLRRAYELRDADWAKVEAVDCASPGHFATVRAEICESVRQLKLIKGTDDRVVQQLRTSRIPYFVPLVTLPDELTLQALHDEFPRVLFVTASTEGLPGMHSLEPDPDADAEERENAAWQGAMAAITNR